MRRKGASAHVYRKRFIDLFPQRRVFQQKLILRRLLKKMDPNDFWLAAKNPVHALMNIAIERAQREDRSRIFDLLKMANMHHIPSQEMPALTYENYFVARLDGKIVGFCGYKILVGSEAKTELMVVDPVVRGRGVGYKLQVRRMEDMLVKGIKTLTTNTDLPATIEWYKKNFGYKEVGTLKKYHEFGDPNIDHWTTLRVDLTEWDKTRQRG